MHKLSSGRMPLLAIAGVALAVGWIAFTSGQEEQRPSDETQKVVTVGQPTASPGRERRKVGPDTQSQSLSRHFIAERREPQWADRGEALLSTQLASVPGQGVGAGLRVRCATTLCEVRGKTPAALDETGRGIYWRMVQGPAVQTFLNGRGLDIASSTLERDGRFTIYYTRNSAR